MLMVKCKYYIRFNAINKPGVLAKIASILAKHNINIKSVIQKGEEVGAVLPIIIITDEALEREIQKVIKKIDNLPIVKSKKISRTSIIKLIGFKIINESYHLLFKPMLDSQKYLNTFFSD